GSMTPRVGDKVVRVGDLDIDTWPKILTAPQQFQQRLANIPPNPVPKWAKDWAEVKRDQPEDEDVLFLQAVFAPPGQDRTSPTRFHGWCELRQLPLAEMVPSVLWFFLKISLFLVGALVLWKRPNDNAAAQFFLLCIVTLGAYMGGYHWPYIATEPVLI